MSWHREDAERVCGDLLQSLINQLPGVSWERAGSREDDGPIYFTNSQGERVCVTISREALEDYYDANERGKSAKEQQLAAHMERIIQDGATKALITSDHL